MNLPLETIEYILRKCDGRTLLACKHVDETFNNLVNYLGERTPIWKWCCNEEIPPKELVEYLEKYKENQSELNWYNIYLNWKSWEKLNYIRCHITLSPVEVPRISCIAVHGEFIAVGTEDGRLKIFNKRWNPIHSTRHLAVNITSVSFINNVDPLSNVLVVVVSFAKGLNIHLFEEGLPPFQVLVLHDIKSHSIFKNYICIEKSGGRMAIAKLVYVEHRLELTEVWFSRIYSPSNLSSMNMWNGNCTFLINNEIRTMRYEDNPNLTPMSMKKKTRIKFTLHSRERTTRVLRNNIVIALYSDKDDYKVDFMEIFMLDDDEQYSKKLFNTWEIFKCSVTCVYVYGNTFIIGVDIGSIYLYHVSSWKNLDLRQYNQKLIIGRHPIIDIDVKEMENERKFYVCSKLNIHEISGYAIDYFTGYK